MDLNKMVMDSLAKMEKEGTVQKIVEKKIENTVAEVIEDVYGKWSSFAKDLKAETQKAVSIDLEALNLPKYNHLVLQVIKEKIESSMNDSQGIKQIEEQIESLLLDTKREYKLSELVKELTNEIDDLYELDYDDYHEMTLHVDDESNYGSYWIAMDAREDIGEYDCKYRMLVSDHGKLYSIKIGSSEYGRKPRNEDFDIKGVLDGLNTGLEETLFKMYASGALLIDDENACKTEISNPEYEG